MTRVRMCVDVSYDEQVTDAESLAIVLDKLVETALSTPGILDEYGNPDICEFTPDNSVREFQP